MNDMTHRSFAARVGRIFRLVRKETTGALRDRRTIVTLFLMPILLYPLLAICFKQFFLSQQADEAPPVYRIGFGDEKAASAIVGYLVCQYAGRAWSIAVAGPPKTRKQG